MICRVLYHVIKNPGPAVFGAVPGAEFTGQAYEVLFNYEKHCRDLGITTIIAVIENMSATITSPSSVFSRFRAMYGESLNNYVIINNVM